MEALVGALAVFGLLFALMAVLDVLALRFGADSRPGYGDDHRRGTPAAWW